MHFWPLSVFTPQVTIGPKSDPKVLFEAAFWHPVPRLGKRSSPENLVRDRERMLYTDIYVVRITVNVMWLIEVQDTFAVD